MRATTGRATTHSPQPGQQLPGRKPAPHDKGLSPPLLSRHQRVVRTKRVSTPAPPRTPPSLCARVLAHHESALTPNPSLPPRHAPGTAPPTVHRGGTRLSRPNIAALHPPRTQQPRTRQQAHTKGASTQASKPGQRDGRTTLPPPPPKRQHQEAQTPTRTRPAHKHEPQPPTEQTRPQQARSSTTRANTRSAHTVTCGRSQV